MKSIQDMIGSSQPDKNLICETHGEFVSKHLFASHWSSCPVCSDERRKEEEAEKIEEERRRKERRMEERIGRSGLPERFRTKELSLFIAETDMQRKALDFSNSYAEGFGDVLKTGRSAIFIGKPGTGKTHLAAGIALSVMRRGAIVYFSTVMRAIRSIKDTWVKDSDISESEAISMFTVPDLLIFDEVGVQFGSEFEKNMLFDIMNERYENRRPSILLSNLSIDEIRGYLGDRVFDRMREDGGKFVVFDWESYRGRK